MYNLEDVVVYKKVGLCKIIKISEMNSMDYYTLETFEKDMTVMCPISKEDLLIRKVVTLQEISQTCRHTCRPFPGQRTLYRLRT